MNSLLIGIQGTVLALDRESGAEIWRTKLKGIGFVNVVLFGGQVLATTSGEIFCLDHGKGEILWHNPLKGLGRGLVTVATDSGSSSTACCEQVLEAEAASAGAAAAAST